MKILNLIIPGLILSFNGAFGVTLNDYKGLMRFSLEAPLNKMKIEAKEITESDPEAELPYYDGRIGLYGPNNKTVWAKVKLRVRGNTSINDCEFPKLELKVEDKAELSKVQEALPGINERIKIGTLCGTETKETSESNMGRSYKAQAPHTEAIVYRMASALGLTTSAAAPANIHFVDSDLKSSYVHTAFLLEYPKDAAKRLGLEFLKAPESAAESHESEFDWDVLDRNSIIEQYLFHALILNSDFSYPFMITENDLWGGVGSISSGSPLWNMKVTQDKSGKRGLYINDFDLATVVTTSGFVGDEAYFKEYQRYNRELAKPGQEIALQMWEKLQSYRSLFGDKELKAALSVFVKKLPILEVMIKALPEKFIASQKILEHHLKQFALASKYFDSKLKLYYGTSNWIQDIKDPDNSVCLVNRGLPDGTPMLLTNEIKNGLQKVYVLDVFQRMFDLDTLKPCTNPGWIEIKNSTFK